MFTARYELIPYIKQITFRLEKVNVWKYLQEHLVQIVAGCLIRLMEGS